MLCTKVVFGLCKLFEVRDKAICNTLFDSSQQNPARASHAPKSETYTPPFVLCLSLFRYIVGGVEFDDMVTSLDLGPTLLAALGANQTLSGTSWWGLVTGEGWQSPPAIVSEILLDRAVVAKTYKLISSESGETTDDYPWSAVARISNSTTSMRIQQSRSAW